MLFFYILTTNPRVMSKGTAFVVGYSLVLIAVFVVFCYLMTIVNPKPLELKQKSGVGGDDGRREFNIEDYPLDEVGEDGSLYGLEKVTGDEETTKPHQISRIIPLYRHLLRQRAFVNSSLVRDVVPPIIPSRQRLSTTTPRQVGLLQKITKQNTTLNTLTAKNPSAKGFRRSINEIETRNSFKEEENSGVILKIIDDSGRSRIEIKLGPNGSFEGNKLRQYRSSGSKVKNSSHANDSDSRDEVESSGKNTIIKILPNNTMVFEEIDHSLVSLNVVKEKSLDYNDRKADTNLSISGNHSISAQTNEANFEEIVLLVKPNIRKTDSSDIPPMNDTEMFTLKMLIDNETKSINQLVKNTGNVNDTVNKQKSVLNFDKKENITDFSKTDSNFLNERNWRTRKDSKTAKSINFDVNNDFKGSQVP